MKANIRTKTAAVFLSLGLFGMTAGAQEAEKVKDLYTLMEWRNIGPALMGGRTVDIEVVESSPWIIYAAVGPSGVWRTENNGVTWEPVFEKEATVSVGDIAVAQSHPHIVWVGTGEATCRNSVTIGDGVYKTTDAGKTWSNMGLKESRHISRILINPADPDIVYVAAMGHLWGTNEERGVFRTLDGGQTWDKVLYVNEKTGIADLAMDPSDPLILYAAAYEHQRRPYHYKSGGPGSALYKSSDGGHTWNRLTKDLPQGVLGRIGIAVSRSAPNVVYSLIEHEDGGIWRSEDRGESWTRTCDNETFKRVNFRPFYYSQIRVDPSDDKRIYVFSGGSFVSDDMGGKFRSISGTTHPDHHDVWIDPRNPLHLIDGNDGGIDMTYDGGKNWQPIRHMALAEVYQVGFDRRDPYYVYCGLQDNGLWGGPSATYDPQGIRNDHWYVVGGGDGFYAQPDPNDFTTVYGNYQMNALYRYNLITGTSKTIRPEASLDDPPYRYNWNTPIFISPHDSNTIYTSAQFLFRSRDRGNSWKVISPDLTTDDPQKQIDSGGPITADNTGAEIHCTIITITESPVTEGVIWCGTDDGNVQVTKDGGKTWTNRVKNISGLPPNTWCSRIDASHFEAGTAYAAFDGHRSDDYGTYVYKTTDFGKTWTSLSAGLPFGWAHVVREDPRNRNLLYVGLEFGIFASLDGGKSWFSLQNNLPTVAVRDIAVHPDARDLIIGTHGRGVWILDDITPLQSVSADVLTDDFFLFDIRPSTQFYPAARGESFSRPVFSGRNPTYGMIINVYFPERPPAVPTIEIKNSGGMEVFKFKLSRKAGLQKKTWNFQYVPRDEKGEPYKISGSVMASPPMVPPGEYRVELKVEEQVRLKTALIKPDPRLTADPEIRILQEKYQVKAMLVQKKASLTVTAVSSFDRRFRSLLKNLEKEADLPAALALALEGFKKNFADLKADVLPPEIAYRGSRETALRGGHPTQMLLMITMNLGGFPLLPTETEKIRISELGIWVDGLVARLNGFIEKEMAALNAALEAAGKKPLLLPSKIEI
jgi:photosystem II stability/assembly factor-like uncharacterized protein